MMSHRCSSLAAAGAKIFQVMPRGLKSSKLMGLPSQNSTPSNSVKSKSSRSADPTERFKKSLDQVAANTEGLLDRLLASKPVTGELARPARLLEAMRYASLGGGKRVRPFLVVETRDFSRCRAAKR